MRRIRTNILNPVSPDKSVLLKDQLLVLDGAFIKELRPFDAEFKETYEDRLTEVAIPGLIDIHVHLSQYRMRGMHRPALLPWLQDCVFPEEERSSDPHYAASVSRDFFNALFKAGTTSAVIYTAPYKEACEMAFQAAEELGARAWIGMTLMDQNSPEGLLQSTAYALDNSFELYWNFHAKTPLLDYIFTPRFAPTCSEELMRRISDFALEQNAWIQTHLSENKDEIRWVRELFGFHSYTELYQDMGLLSDHTILAHCIHLCEKEIQILKNSGAAIAHCPDSNFYLKSGEIDLPSLLSHGLKIALGSDVGAGTSLFMLYHAKMMNFRQSVYPVSPELAFYSTTLGAANLLHKDHELGSLDVGKQADICLLKLEDEQLEQGIPVDEDLLAKLVFFGSEIPVQETIIAGRSVYKASDCL